MMSNLTDEEINNKIEEYKQEIKFREIQKKRKILRKENLKNASKRKAENKIKYILGGTILLVLGYKIVFQLLDKTKTLRPQDLEAIETFKNLFDEEIKAQEKQIEKAKKEKQENAQSD